MIFFLTATRTAPRTFHWTREVYDRLVELGFFHQRRVQLIDGEIYEMSPQGASHAMAIQLAHDALERAFGHGFCIRSQLPLALSPVSEPEPDVAVVRGTPRDYPNHPNSALLVVEVSDTTLEFDATRKAAVYARAGIAEYWIVNLAEARLDVYRGPSEDARFDLGAGYVDVRGYGRGDQVSPLAKPTSVVRVADLLP
jgi:Uma2 family endonuclease